jgi:hypothetical protein
MTTETIIEPLIGNSNAALVGDMKALKKSCIVFGFLYGIFIQFSTLGANWVIISILGLESFAAASQMQLFIFSLIWSAISSALTVCLLKLVCDVIRVVNTMHTEKYRYTDRYQLVSTSRLQDLLSYIEIRFVASAFAGVCVAWVTTDYFLGLKIHMTFALIALSLVCASACCFLRKRTLDVGEIHAYSELLTDDEDENKIDADMAYDVTIL